MNDPGGINVDVDGDRVVGELNQLATFSSAERPPPMVTRVVYSPEDLAARDYLDGLYRDAGFDVRVDAVGNTFVRWEGADPSAGVVGTGSHIDAIPAAGMYDGTVGVIGGLEAMRALQRTGFRPRRSIELVMITSEEPTRFGTGCLGSRAIAGTLTTEELSHWRDGDDRSFDDVRTAAGFDGEVASARVASDYFASWVELHIEQGPRLERDGDSIGVVTAIAAPATLEVVVEGVGGHAGATLMNGRKDALCAAAEMMLAVESVAERPDQVATVGDVAVYPGATNSIPSKVRFPIDLRDIDGDARDASIRSLAGTAGEIARRRGVAIDVRTLHADPPASCDDAIISAIESSAAAGLSHRRMVSRAYHDTLFIARVSPVGMIFIPCRDGVSHRPDEYSSPRAIADGVRTLAGTLARLSGQ